MAGEVLHEDRAQLDPQILDKHRAISTLMEELEAIDWYNQRLKATDNGELQNILRHNRNEEKEHASMLLEWIRRHDEEFSTHMKTFLFSTGPIREAVQAPASATGQSADDGSLAIGSLRERQV